VERSPRLLRKPRGKGGVWLGLCAGIGAHLGLDPVFIRLVWLVLTLLPVGGLSMLLLYVIFALCVPLEDAAA
jgi:phage shock protein PspC (stress-responsive transcriptional regulator)